MRIHEGVFLGDPSDQEGGAIRQIALPDEGAPSRTLEGSLDRPTVEDPGLAAAAFEDLVVHLDHLVGRREPHGPPGCWSPGMSSRQLG